MRPWALLALLAVLATPAAAAQGSFTLAPGTYRAFPVTAQEGSRYDVGVTSDAPVDVLLVNGTDDAYVAGTGGRERAFEHLDVTAVREAGAFPRPGRWTLIVDNSADPPGGANGTANATLQANVTFSHPAPEPPAPTPAGGGGVRDPWPVLMLTAPYWDLAILGLGGMALWFLLVAAVAAPGYKEGWEKVGVLGVGAALLVAAWSLLPGKGPIAAIGLPLLFAAGIAWVATRGATDARQAVRMAFLSAGLGAFAGVVAAHLLRLAWADPGLMLVGAGGFDDPLFVLPVAAALGALLIGVVTALVAADEDEPADPVAQAPGLGATFTVTCLRCQTPIKVDRSMKRYRVATDRFEFACPNCHAWMEWAEPRPDGAAAA